MNIFRNYLDHLPPLNLSSFESDLMKTEFERLAGRQPMDTLSMKRYELPTPPPGKMTDVQVHTIFRSINNVSILHSRITHLTSALKNLFLRLGQSVWRTAAPSWNTSEPES